MLRRSFLFILLGVLVLVSGGVRLLLSNRKPADVASLPSELASQEGVSIETRISPSGRGWVVHLLDYQYVPEASFAKDVRSSSIIPIKDREIAMLYAEHVDTVEKVRLEQAELLLWLGKHKSPCVVFIEGLVPGMEKAIVAKADALAARFTELSEQFKKAKASRDDMGREIEEIGERIGQL